MQGTVKNVQRQQWERLTKLLTELVLSLDRLNLSIISRTEDLNQTTLIRARSLDHSKDQSKDHS